MPYLRPAELFMPQSYITQRWRNGAARYRPAGELIQPREYDVAPIASDREASAFIKQHHYSGTYPAARFRFGLYRAGLLSGVAVFSHPANNKTLTNTFAFELLEGVELGRFVLLDEVPGNGETWFLARCFAALRTAGIKGVVSFSDDQPRQSAGGQIVFPGHIGTIYQAFNGSYLGRGTARSLRLLPDGTVLSARSLQKIRSGERGVEYATALLTGYGADAVWSDRPAWLRFWLPRLTRPLAHPGCHKYAWILDRRLRRFQPPSLPYPKRIHFSALPSLTVAL
jgi:hypothetical protein